MCVFCSTFLIIIVFLFISSVSILQSHNFIRFLSALLSAKPAELWLCCWHLGIDEHFLTDYVNTVPSSTIVLRDEGVRIMAPYFHRKSLQSQRRILTTNMHRKNDNRFRHHYFNGVFSVCRAHGYFPADSLKDQNH